MDIIVDVDGTLADPTHRLHWLEGSKPNWKAFMKPEVMAKDPPIQPVITVVQTLFHSMIDAGVIGNVLIVSARNERHRSVTLKWLEDNDIPFERLYLRNDDDRRPDDIVKKEILASIRAEGYDPRMVFDDRLSVCKMWAEEGLFCFCVNQGLVDF